MWLVSLLGCGPSSVTPYGVPPSPWGKASSGGGFIHRGLFFGDDPLVKLSLLWYNSEKPWQGESFMQEEHTTEIQKFEERSIRTAWDEEREEWYFSVVDVIAVLTDSIDPTAYWGS